MMNLTGEHVSKSFDNDLKNLVNEFLKMGGMAEDNIRTAIKALVEVDGELAEQAIAVDKKINQSEQALDELVVKILVKRQPAATDLRLIMAISKANADLERIGDETKKIAKMARRSTRQGQAPLGQHEAQQMGNMVLKMLQGALESFTKSDLHQAFDVIQLDEEIDALYKLSSRALMTYIIEDGRYVSNVIDILWVFRALERIGAHARNIAEQVIYCISGYDVRYKRFPTIADAREALTKTSVTNTDDHADS